MSAIRIVPVLLILSGLVLFALQNMSPALPLVILGTATQSFPLALWIGGAIASGAATTLLIFGLSSLGRPARRTPSRPAANRFSGTAASVRNPFARAASVSTSGSTARSAAGATRLQDDWETLGQKEEWDDWEEPQASTSSNSSYSSGASSDSSFRNPQPEIRDRTDEAWQNWDGYEDSRRDDSRRDDRRDADPEPRIPRRTDFEIKRAPATRHQSGSVYSYGYKQPDDVNLEDVDLRGAASERSGVYDAEYRVITPPYRPDPEIAPVPPDDWRAAEELAEPFDSDANGSNFDNSDFDNSDFDSSDSDRNRRDRRTL